MGFGFPHWFCHSIPVSVTEIAEGTAKADMPGVSLFGPVNHVYYGPAPMGTHTYEIWIYAMKDYDVTLLNNNQPLPGDGTNWKEWFEATVGADKILGSDSISGDYTL